MENPTPFDLNEAVRFWREQVSRSPVFRTENLDELESHLRDSVATLKVRGFSEEKAWVIAQRRLGYGQALENEFAKVNAPSRIMRVFLALLAAIAGLLALVLGVASRWLFYLIDGRYAIIGMRDKSIIYTISTQRGWFIFVADVLLALLFLWVAFALVKHAKGQRLKKNAS